MERAVDRGRRTGRVPGPHGDIRGSAPEQFPQRRGKLPVGRIALRVDAADEGSPVEQRRTGRGRVGSGFDLEVIQPGAAGVGEIHVIHAGIGGAPGVVAGLVVLHGRRRGVLADREDVRLLGAVGGVIINAHGDVVGALVKRIKIRAPGLAVVRGAYPQDAVRPVLHHRAGPRRAGGYPGLEPVELRAAEVRKTHVVDRPRVGSAPDIVVGLVVQDGRVGDVFQRVEDVVARGEVAQGVVSAHRHVVGGGFGQREEVDRPVGAVGGRPGRGKDIGPVLQHGSPAGLGRGYAVLRRGQARAQVGEVDVVDRAGSPAPGVIPGLEIGNGRRGGVFAHHEDVRGRGGKRHAVEGARRHVIEPLAQRGEIQRPVGRGIERSRRGEDIGPVLEHGAAARGRGGHAVLRRGHPGSEVGEIHVERRARVGGQPGGLGGLVVDHQRAGGIHREGPRGRIRGISAGQVEGPDAPEIVAVGHAGQLRLRNRRYGRGVKRGEIFSERGFERITGHARPQVRGIGPVEGNRVQGIGGIIGRRGGGGHGRRGSIFQHVESVHRGGTLRQRVEGAHRDVARGPFLQGGEIHRPVRRVGRGAAGRGDIGPVLKHHAAAGGRGRHAVLGRGEARELVEEIHVIGLPGRALPGAVPGLVQAQRRRRGVLLNIEGVVERGETGLQVVDAQGDIVPARRQRVEHRLRQRPAVGIAGEPYVPGDAGPGHQVVRGGGGSGGRDLEVVQVVAGFGLEVHVVRAVVGPAPGVVAGLVVDNGRAGAFLVNAERVVMIGDVPGLVVGPHRDVRNGQVGQRQVVHAPVVGIRSGVDARGDVGPGDHLAAGAARGGPGGVLRLRQQRTAGVGEIHVERGQVFLPLGQRDVGLVIGHVRRGRVLLYIERVRGERALAQPVVGAHGNVISALRQQVPGAGGQRPVGAVRGHVKTRSYIRPAYQLASALGRQGIDAVLHGGDAGIQVAEVHVEHRAGVGGAPGAVAGLVVDNVRPEGVLEDGKDVGAGSGGAGHIPGARGYVVGPGGQQGEVNAPRPREGTARGTGRDHGPADGITPRLGGTCPGGILHGVEAGPVIGERHVVDGPRFGTAPGGFTGLVVGDDRRHGIDDHPERRTVIRVISGVVARLYAPVMRGPGREGTGLLRSRRRGRISQRRETGNCGNLESVAVDPRRAVGRVRPVEERRESGPHRQVRGGQRRRDGRDRGIFFHVESVIKFSGIAGIVVHPHRHPAQPLGQRGEGGGGQGPVGRVAVGVDT